MSRIKTDSTRTNIYMPNTLLNAGKKVATLQGITYSELVRTAVRSYVLGEIERMKDAKETRTVQEKSPEAGTQ